MLELGHGVTARYTSCQKHGARTGAIVAFDGGCEGLVSWCGCHEPAWTLVELEPLTLDPSVACSEHPEHHGWIRGGRWEPA